MINEENQSDKKKFKNEPEFQIPPGASKDLKFAQI